MTIFEQTKELIKNLLFNRMFWVGFIVCFAFFSKYILGPDNLLEQLGEKVLQENTGIDIDFSPDKDGSKS